MQAYLMKVHSTKTRALGANLGLRDRVNARMYKSDQYWLPGNNTTLRLNSLHCHYLSHEVFRSQLGRPQSYKKDGF